MLEFCVASKQDFSLICDVWREGFPEDTAEDVMLFWQHLGQNATCLLGKKDEHPVSMAFLIPANIGGEEWWYVYAAVTRKAERGNGYFAALLDAAAALALQKNVAGLFLRPAEESLFSY